MTPESLRRREVRWAVVDHIGKGRQIRTVPVPSWVKETLDAWLTAVDIEGGPLFRSVYQAEKHGNKSFQKRRSGTLSRRLRRA
jgi:integrase